MADRLNKSYTVEADNLVIAAKYPVIKRTISMAKPSADIKRGAALTAEEGAYSMAVAATTDIVAIAAEDVAVADAGETVALSVYVSGVFNAAEVTGPTSATANAVVLAAQKNGIYLL